MPASPSLSRTGMTGLAWFAASVLAATPAAAALPRLAWVSLCSGGERHWLAIPLGPPDPARPDRQPDSGCAHLSCPRKSKLVPGADPDPA